MQKMFVVERNKARMIYLIITTSIILNEISRYYSVDDPNRERWYLECIRECMNMVHEIQRETKTGIIPVCPVIVENNGKRQTPLNQMGCEVVYTNNNQLSFPHKGGNELADIKAVLRHCNVKDDDLVIKMTDRYKFINTSFLKDVIRRQHEYDAFLKFVNVCTCEFMRDDCVLGAYALRGRLLKEFDYKYERSGESEFATYIRDHVAADRVCEVQHIGMECCFSDNLRIEYI